MMYYTRMLFVTMVTYFILLAVERSSADRPDTQKKNHRDKAQDFLVKFGYAKGDSAGKVGDDDFKSGVEAVQEFAGLPITGVLDDATLNLLNTSRCGVPDNYVRGGRKNRTRRYALLGPKWPNPLSLTYNINNYPSASLTSTVVQSVLAKSIKTWSDVACLYITQLVSAAANIQVGFYAYDHGDGYPFDGPLKVLAHAFSPTNGRLHFDNSETWTNATTSGINMLQVAVHELGHILGLDHSTVQTAVMYPYYTGYQPNFALDPDDIAGMRALYGYCTTTTRTSTTTTPTTTRTSTTTPTTTRTSTTTPTTTRTTTRTSTTTPTTTRTSTTTPTTTRTTTRTSTTFTTTKSPTTTCRVVCA